MATRGRATRQEGWDDDGHDNEAEGYGDRDILMGNLNARRSWVDVMDSEEDHHQNGRAAPVRNSLGAKAGVILVCCSSLSLSRCPHAFSTPHQGIQNIFVVIPQFLVTGMTSFIFAILEPQKSVLHGNHPGKTPPNLNITTITTDNSTLVSSRQELGANGPPSGPNSVAIIFR